MKRLSLILVFALLAAVAVAQNDAEAKRQRLKQLFAEKPYWECVKFYKRCVIRNNEIAEVVEEQTEGQPIGEIFNFDTTKYTRYQPSPRYWLQRKEFDDTTYIKKETMRWTIKGIILLDDGRIAMCESHLRGALINRNEITNVKLLAPITEEQFERTKPTARNDGAAPTLEEYFHDAQPIPRNIKKILRSAKCWTETAEACTIKDGVVRVIGSSEGYAGVRKFTLGYAGVRKFTRGFKGEYFIKTRNGRYNSGKFQLRKDDFRYYLDGDIIYIPHNQQYKGDNRLYYYRLTPSKYSFDGAKQRILSPPRTSTPSRPPFATPVVTPIKRSQP